MKSHDLKKALCQWTAMLALVVSGAVWAANGVDFSQSPEVSGTQEGRGHSDAKRAGSDAAELCESAANDPA